MKKLTLSIFLLLFVALSFNSNAQGHKIQLLIQMQVTTSTTLTLFTDTVMEGTKYYIKAKTIDPPYQAVQPLYNAMVGSSFEFRSGSITQDIQLRLTFTNINSTTGQYFPGLGSLAFFGCFSFRVYDFQGINPLPTPFNFVAPNYFRLTLKRTAAFATFLASTGINPNVIAFAYYIGPGIYSFLGIDLIPPANNDSLVVDFHHFSNIYGGDRSGLTSVPEEKVLPTSFSIDQNYPNPFNPSTLIKYSVPQRSKIELKVYNVLGVHVATLFSGEKEAGVYEATFNAGNIPSGVYFYELRSENYIQTRKMMLLK